jgi:hypothetical protein
MGFIYIYKKSSTMKRILMVFAFLIIGLVAFAQQQVQLSWNASTDNVGVQGYNIWLNAEYYGTTSDTFFIFSLDPGLYAVSVSAFDAAGNESDQSEVLMIDVKDTESPTIPDSLIWLYPNPNLGNFTLRFGKEIIDNSFVQIIQTNGKIVYQRRLPPADIYYEERFNLFEIIDPGIYVIALFENGERISHTFLMVTNKPKKLMSKSERSLMSPPA